MTEVIFPIFGTAFVLLIVLPVFALAAKALLCLLEQRQQRGPLHGLGLRYAIITGSSFLPLAWLLSAALHQAETGASMVQCLFDHSPLALCFEPGLFIATLALVCTLACMRELRAASAARLACSARATALQVRLNRIVAERNELRDLLGRVRVTDDAGAALRTQGALRPYVVVELSYAEHSSDDELAGALGHEAEHVRAYDPLRYLVLALALGVNPFGRALLQRHAASWLVAREAHCDREAVIRGAAPLSLAQALLRAARPRSWLTAALGASDAALLKLRVELLMAFDEQAPTRCCERERSYATTALALLVIAIVLPHHTGTAALDVLHIGTEQVLHYLWS